MNRIVLIKDTAKPIVRQTADWFISQNDRVYLAVTRLPDHTDADVNYLVFDPFCEESLSLAAAGLKEQEGRLDILILGTSHTIHDGEIGTQHDYDQMLDVMMENVYGNLQTVKAFEPLLKCGMKRIAGIVDIESSNNYAVQADDMAYHASAAAFNMMGKVLFNHLRPDGFTFRWYCEDEKQVGICAAEYIAAALCYDEKEPYTHSDENRLVLRNALLREIPW